MTTEWQRKRERDSVPAWSKTMPWIETNGIQNLLGKQILSLMSSSDRLHFNETVTKGPQRIETFGQQQLNQVTQVCLPQTGPAQSVCLLTIDTGHSRCIPERIHGLNPLQGAKPRQKWLEGHSEAQLVCTLLGNCASSSSFQFNKSDSADFTS